MYNFIFWKKYQKNTTFSLTVRKMIDKVCVDVYTTKRLYGGFIMNFKEINKGIPIPVYYQLKEIIREKIENWGIKDWGKNYIRKQIKRNIPD